MLLLLGLPFLTGTLLTWPSEREKGNFQLNTGLCGLAIASIIEKICQKGRMDLGS